MAVDVTASVLDVTDLVVKAGAARTPVVRGVGLRLGPGESLGLVGASGSGKSMTASAVVGLLPAGARAEGSVRFQGRELLGLADRELSRLRGNRIAMVFQDPLAALTPVFTVGAQIAEAITVHRAVGRSEARRRAVELLDRVGIADAATRSRAYPHEFSGGMRQRVAIAMAMANEPDLIIADEPTSALDVTVQAQILDVLDEARRATGAALLLITHDLGVVARSCDRVAVMRDGLIAEEGTVAELFTAPEDGPLRRMLDTTPRMPRPGTAAERPAVRSPEVLRVERLRRRFSVRSAGRRTEVRAVDGVDLEVRAGEAVALLGESGCGKSTTLMEILRLAPPEHGRIEVLGHDLALLDARTRKALRHRIQIVFQDPSASLDPRMTVADIIAEPLRAAGRSRTERAARVGELLDLVDLPADAGERRPGRLSGGQRQRVAIARALALEPDLVLLDEPVSALDTALRADIMELLDTLRARLGLSYLLVSHDIPLVRRYADRVAVMYLGRVVDIGTAAEVLDDPAHPYTRGLRASVLEPAVGAPRSDQEAVPAGELPSPLAGATPSGCAFRTRCPAVDRLAPHERRLCHEREPELLPITSVSGRRVACHHPVRGSAPFRSVWDSSQPVDS
ncbi:ABC transporter ATP-binding protein [Streptomyces sp. NPDC000070]|uniref:ABC transporter ATP-binding protein n=1 Tax=Streptomyces sp. NPDC000070 TaxID=3154240 RepID=UPI00331D6E35